MNLDDGGIPYGSFDHEQPGYYRSEYIDLEKKFKKLEKYARHKWDCPVEILLTSMADQGYGAVDAGPTKCTCGLDEILGYKKRTWRCV